MLKRFACQNEDPLEAGAAAWVSWPRLELAVYPAQSWVAAVLVRVKDPPSALPAVCGGSKSPNHDPNQPPDSCLYLLM